MTRTAWTLALVATIAVVAASVLSVQCGLVARSPQVVDDLPPYGDELRALPLYGDDPSSDADPGQSYAGPGWYPRRSPDGAYVAATESWGGVLGNVFLGFVIDRPFIHSVGIWHQRTGHYVRILSIMEADPHSGIAHRYVWSKDSKALLIHGSGRLADDYEKPIYLCIVYLPDTDALYRLTKCPKIDLVGGFTAPQNKGMKQTKPEHIGASQLIPGVRRTILGSREPVA